MTFHRPPSSMRPSSWMRRPAKSSGYNQAGNVTQISDTSTAGAETQCFAYDSYQRLTEAWTPATQKCTDTRSASTLGGPAPYWTSYTYNTAGQRTSETTHKTTGDTKTTYCYTKTSQPHTLREPRRARGIRLA